MANQAERRSVELEKQIDSAKSKVAELQTSVSSRLEAMQQLEKVIKQSQSEASELQAGIAQQSHAVQQLKQQYEVAVTNKNSADLTQIYPMLGRHIVQSRGGLIDAKNKKPQGVYLTLLLSISSPTLSNAKAVAKV